MMSIIETRDLTRCFGELTAVDHLNIAVEAGECFGLLGPNGAGKTTAIKMLATLLPPTAGTATVAGFDVRRRPGAVRRLIGYVPQVLSADGTLTGYENMLLFAKLYDVPRGEREARVEDGLSFMGLSEVAHHLVRTYSGGMIRRLEIATALIHRPAVLFLDEPTVGLDPLARKSVWERISELRSTSGMTVLLTTHYMEEADSLCGRVAIMHLGRVMVIGSPAELKLSIGGDGVTLEDVFAHYTGDELSSGGTYRDTQRARRTARRLG